MDEPTTNRPGDEAPRVLAHGCPAGADHDREVPEIDLLREPYWALKAQHELGAEPLWPTPYGYAVRRRAK